MKAIVFIIPVIVVVAMIACGWFIAAESWAQDESERLFNDKIRTMKFRVHIQHVIIDEMKRGDSIEQGHSDWQIGC